MVVKIEGTPPASIAISLERSLQSASWLSLADDAAIALAERLAIALDVAFNTGELKEVPQLAQRFTAILQQLHLTVETRTQGKQEEENDGSEHRENYLRLLSTAPNESAAGITKRGASSK